MNGICLCGTEAGYPHPWDCPRPLYRFSVEVQRQWEAERERIRKAAETSCEFCPAAGGGCSVCR